MIFRKKVVELKVDEPKKVDELFMRSSWAVPEEVTLIRPGFGVIPRRVMKKLGIKEGDLVEVEGKSKAVIAAILRDSKKAMIGKLDMDSSKDIITLDSNSKSKIGVNAGDIVKLRKIECQDAETITLNPESSFTIMGDMADFLRYEFADLKLIKGEKVELNLFQETFTFSIENTVPEGYIKVTPKTRFIVSNTQSNLKFPGEQLKFRITPELIIVERDNESIPANAILKRNNVIIGVTKIDAKEEILRYLQSFDQAFGEWTKFFPYITGPYTEANLQSLDGALIFKIEYEETSNGPSYSFAAKIITNKPKTKLYYVNN